MTLHMRRRSDHWVCVRVSWIRCRAEIGYAIAAKYWGQGIGTKAVKIAVSQVFKDVPDLVRVQAFVDVENKASQRVLEKAGFVKEGILKKYVYVKGIIKDVAIFSLVLDGTHPPL
ncbi:N-acetyltransferase YoaA [Spatholobus suberectus]|nr:N-acetyltransferase YoaA [Spatholobus suberectus]